MFKHLLCSAGSRNTFNLCHFEKTVNIHKAKSVNEVICHWQRMDGDALLKTRKPLVFVGSTVCLFDWVCKWKLQDICVWTVGILMRAWKQKQKGNWFTFCCSSVSSKMGNRLQRSSARGHFYRLLYLSILTGEKSLGRDSLEDSVEHHVVDFIQFSASYLRSPPLIYDAFHGAFKRRVVF